AALTDRGGDSFHGAESHVAAGEDARNAGLEEVRVAVELPASGAAHVGAGEHVAPLVECDLGWEPRGFGVRADEDEQTTRLEPGRVAGGGVVDVDRLERGVPVRGDHLGP